MKKLHRIRQLIAAILCSAMLLPLTSCGDPGSSRPTEASADAQTTSAQGSVSEQEPAVAPSTEQEQTAAKQKYSDFYMEVNNEWFEEHPLKPGKPSSSYASDASDLVQSRFAEMLENASLDDFAEDDPMRKMFLFYQQIREDGPDRPAAMARIRELTDAIEAPKTPKQFCDNILKNQDFRNFNNLLSIDYTYCTDYRYRIRYYAIPLHSLYIDKSEEEIRLMTDAYGRMLEALGYPRETALSIAQNAMKVDGMVWEYLNSCDDPLVYYYEDEEYPDENLQKYTFPFMDIQKSLGYTLYLYSTGEESENSFFARESYLDFIEELFAPENLQLVKDYFVVCALEELSIMGNAEFTNAYDGIMMDFAGIPKEEQTFDPADSSASAAVLSFDTGILNKWYTDQYVTDAQKSEILALADEVKGEMQEIFNEIEWASPKARRAWTVKTENIGYILGSYDEYNDHSDMEIGKTSIDTLLSLLQSNRTYNKKFLRGTGQKSDTYSANLSVVNAFYLKESSAIAICNGMLAQMELLGPDASYEEKLALMGRLIAHEMAHGFDANNITLDGHGVSLEWYDETYNNNYLAMTTDIYNFYDGMTTGYGNTISGSMVYNEAFCDLMAMRCCLQALAKHENVDYDAFFRACARQQAFLITPKGEELLLRADYHLPDHERVNYLLAQFEEFYDTYEIDENNPYYVPKNRRLTLFQLRN